MGISFLFRPLGAFLAGHFADRIGRRAVLMTTLVMMGGATTLIGLVPTYATAGALAPILLVSLRLIQGLSAGGEWGSAVLLAVEHAPAGKRGLFSAGPQIGAPAGLLLSSAALAVVNIVAPGDAFTEWGWRVPFLLSFPLMIVAWWVRVRVDESPVYERMAAERERTPRAPIATLFARFSPLVLAGALLFAANGTAGYMTTGGYIQKYATNEHGMPRGDILWAVTAAAAVWLASTAVTGWLSDRVGRKRTLVVGFVVQALGVVALFPLVNTASLPKVYAGLFLVAVGLGLTYGQIGALFAELFPASIRASGASISYALGAILGGAFAPTIAAALRESTGSTTAITAYLLAAALVGLAVSLLLRDRTDIPLGHEHEKEQSVGHFVWQPAAVRM
ncbi:MFS transporter [Corynebacterium liangguodongii]|uniref:MFS transporter n=1 Tax=Corynebacterium liangguodongii TaxID=2079535 RepID=UPI002E273153|nr:MFS transporter [Corynebacterium liangguodongii]